MGAQLRLVSACLGLMHWSQKNGLMPSFGYSYPDFLLLLTPQKGNQHE